MSKFAAFFIEIQLIDEAISWLGDLESLNS